MTSEVDGRKPRPQAQRGMGGTRCPRQGHLRDPCDGIPSPATTSPQKKQGHLAKGKSPLPSPSPPSAPSSTGATTNPQHADSPTAHRICTIRGRRVDDHIGHREPSTRGSGIRCGMPPPIRPIGLSTRSEPRTPTLRGRGSRRHPPRQPGSRRGGSTCRP